MKKLLLTVSLLMGGLLNAQTYPFYENFDAMTSGAAPTGTWVTPTNGFKVMANHGATVPNACSSQMNTGHTTDTIVSPLIGPTTSTSYLSLDYRIVDAALYPNTGTAMGVGDTITIDAYLGPPFNAWQLGMAKIHAGNHPAMNTYTTFTYSPGFAGLTAKIRVDVARANGDWWIDIDNVFAKDAGSTFGINYHTSNAPSLLATPCPSNGDFVVWMKNYSGTGAVELKLYNNMGQLVKKLSADNILNKQFSVNGTDLAKGIYLIEVSSGNDVSKTKIVIE